MIYPIWGIILAQKKPLSYEFLTAFNYFL